MSKDEEKARFTAFIKALPRGSYLSSILRYAEIGVFKAIDDDLEFISFTAMHEEQKVHRDAVEQLRKQRDELKAEVRRLEQQKAKLEVEIDNIRSEARAIAFAKAK